MKKNINIVKFFKENKAEIIFTLTMIAALILLFIGASMFLRHVCRAEEEDANAVQAATIPPAQVYETETLFPGGRNNYVTLHNNGESATTKINIRNNPDIDAEKIGELPIGVEYRTTSAVLRANGYIGLSAADLGFEGNGTVWICALYVSATSSDFPENLDDPSSYPVNLGTACNNNCKVIIAGRPKLRSCPSTADRSEYCCVPEGYSFEISNSFLNETNSFVGFYANEVGLEGIYGNIDADPDGIVWVSVDYVSFIK